MTKIWPFKHWSLPGSSIPVLKSWQVVWKIILFEKSLGNESCKLHMEV